jgi:hypothetical protein
MAVVQISKIQHRRGRKNSGSSLPQLASGELGWAIDTQELYIGNGSVSEGAPYVGNTKVITEHDNILDLALQYQYKRNDQLTSSIANMKIRDLLSEMPLNLNKDAPFIFNIDVSVIIDTTSKSW